MHKVFVADKLAPEGINALKKYPELNVVFKPGLSVEEAVLEVKDADAVIVRSATKLKGELLEATEKLKVIGRAGIGVDNIDVDRATEKGVVVLNTPDANATTTAELAIAHIFSLSRNLPEADKSVRLGKWERNKFLGVELSGKTVGIVGFGTIGRLVAERCIGLKMRVLGFDPYVTEETFKEHAVEKRELEELLAKSDYVTLHCPVTEGTREMFNAHLFSKMKNGSFLINCARGELVKEEALADAIKSGSLAGAAVDVFKDEPPKDSSLLELDKVYFTPHLGASTHEAQSAVGVEIAHSIASYLIEGEVRNAVNVPNLETEKLQRMQPYAELGRKLGLLIGSMAKETISSLEVATFGDAAKLDTHSITSSVIIGLLKEHHSVPVNQINALYLARRQGMQVSEISSLDSRDYVSILRVTITTEKESLTLEGTIFDGLHPRLVRVGDYEIESPLHGHLLFTWHADQPGVIGSLGEILGKLGINISRMQVGVSENMQLAIAILGISKGLSKSTIDTIEKLDAVSRALQVEV
ncbi:MAG: phosphoglycerate dehydrogenase [Pseudomonadota bacterium]|nr:phosphoglycerate dehydrogenase [Pseudomonadota bacterium]